MDNLLNFVSKYYIVFIIISVVLILALIGYIADKKTKEDIIIKKHKKHNPENIETIDENKNESPKNQPDNL